MQRSGSFSAAGRTDRRLPSPEPGLAGQQQLPRRGGLLSGHRHGQARQPPVRLGRVTKDGHAPGRLGAFDPWGAHDWHAILPPIAISVAAQLVDGARRGVRCHLLDASGEHCCSLGIARVGGGPPRRTLHDWRFGGRPDPARRLRQEAVRPDRESRRDGRRRRSLVAERAPVRRHERHHRRWARRDTRPSNLVFRCCDDIPDPLLPRLEPAQRPAMAQHVHGTAPMGSCVIVRGRTCEPFRSGSSVARAALPVSPLHHGRPDATVARRWDWSGSAGASGGRLRWVVGASALRLASSGTGSR